MEEFRKLLSGHRTTEIIALRLLAMVPMKKFELFECFYAFRNNSQLEAPGHANHRGHYCRIAISACDLPHEGLVDLQRVDWEFSQIAQAGISGAKVIDGHLYAAFSQGLQDEGSARDSLHQYTFGQLEFERPWIQT